MKYLTLDIGNVIARLDFDKFIATLSKAVNISRDEAFYFLSRTQRLHDVALTDLNEQFRESFKIKSELVIQELLEEWNKTIIPNKTVIEWMHKLIDTKDITIALLSNIGNEHAELMKTALSSIYKHKNIIKFFSCFCGARKPTLLYYHLFLTRYPEFSGCVYVDDNKENLKTGRFVGFRDIQFDLSSDDMNDDNILLRLSEIERAI